MIIVSADLGAIGGWNGPAALVVAKITVVLLAGTGITVLMQRASAGARHLVWLLTLATLLVMPSLNAWSPLHFRVLPSADVQTAAVQPSPVSPLAASGSVDQVQSRSDYSAVQQQAPTPSQRVIARVKHNRFVDRIRHSAAYQRARNMAPLDALLLVWLAVAAVITGWLGFAALQVRRIVRHSTPLSDRDWSASLWEVSDRLGLSNAPRLVRSELVKMPFACGVITPTIVLPAECDAWSHDRRNAVLLHELAHVRRHDLAGHTLGRLACAVYWFHPLVWSAAKRLRSESERACDDLAITCGARASDYAEHLLDIVTSVRGDRTPSVALAMARRKEFEGRMLAVLDPELRHSTPGRAQTAALIASLALVAVVVGAASPARYDTHGSDPKVQPQAAQAARAATEFAIARDMRISMQKSVQTAIALSKREAHAVSVAPQTSADVSSSSASSSSSSSSSSSTSAQSVAGVTVAPPAPPAPVASKLTGRVLIEAQKLVQGRNDRSDERETLLVRVLSTDTSARLRRIAAWGLAEYGDNQNAVHALAATLGQDHDATVREMAGWAMGSSGGNSSISVPALASALHGDADASVRKVSAWALGSSGDRDAEPALNGALGDNSADVRALATWGLGSLGISAVPSALAARLNDSDARVRTLAAWALHNIRDESTIPALNTALRAEKDKKVQLAEIRALASMGDRSVAALSNLLSSPDADVKATAVEALAGRSAGGPWPWPWPWPRPFP